MREDFLDEDLFGNEAGEDEDRSKLAEYYLEKPENAVFFSTNRRLAFVRARKGVGKSALLSYASYKIEKNKPKSICIFIKAAELLSLKPTPPSDSNFFGFINFWQECLCSRIAIEIGKTVHYAGRDDSIAIVEMAEISGYKGRNIVSALCGRFQKAMGSLDTVKSMPANSVELLKRYASEIDVDVWFFIDDIDATYVDNPYNRMLISSFFSACRNIINLVNGLYIRASARTDIWTMIKEDESLDKCEQYMVDLKWSTADTGKILANKMRSYYLHKRPDDEEFRKLKMLYPHSLHQVYRLVFTEFLPWGRHSLLPHMPIHILSAGRPRWAAQLCKLAAKDAYKKNNNKIAIGHINYVLFEYGQFRLTDLYKEHSHQCNQLKHIVESFRNKQKAYSTADLLRFIDTAILSSIGDTLSIDGITTIDALSVAHFLYRIGFITLDDDTIKNGESFVRFEDLPDLLIPANINFEDIWAVHPSYRNVLHLS